MSGIQRESTPTARKSSAGKHHSVSERLQPTCSLAKAIIASTALTFLAIASPASAFAPVMPLAKVTPGAINTSVTQGNIHSTICVAGFTKTIRPPSSYTHDLKVEQLGSSYRRYHDASTSHFEEDHLISLELGGSPDDPRNLWPEPYSGAYGARAKDRLENKLNKMVCSGAISLHSAQVAISKNWWNAFLKYVQ